MSLKLLNKVQQIETETTDVFTDTYRIIIL
jgi:hypothetical protein